jgi:hypothetical protein
VEARIELRNQCKENEFYAATRTHYYARYSIVKCVTDPSRDAMKVGKTKSHPQVDHEDVDGLGAPVESPGAWPATKGSPSFMASPPQPPASLGTQRKT